jgi:hypothetical protein
MDRNLTLAARPFQAVHDRHFNPNNDPECPFLRRESGRPGGRYTIPLPDAATPNSSGNKPPTTFVDGRPSKVHPLRGWGGLSSPIPQLTARQPPPVATSKNDFPRQGREGERGGEREGEPLEREGDGVCVCVEGGGEGRLLLRNKSSLWFTLSQQPLNYITLGLHFRSLHFT